MCLKNSSPPLFLPPFFFPPCLLFSFPLFPFPLFFFPFLPLFPFSSPFSLFFSFFFLLPFSSPFPFPSLSLFSFLSLSLFPLLLDPYISPFTSKISTRWFSGWANRPPCLPTPSYATVWIPQATADFILTIETFIVL